MSDWVALGIVLLVAWVAPVAAVEGFAREMARRDTGVANYRGRTVFLGLGLAWLVTSVAARVAPSPAVLAIGGPGLLLLVPAAFAFGLLDDAYGTAEDRGFRGHLRALAAGRLTTGMLKAMGIAALSLATAPGWSRLWAEGYDPAALAALLAGAATIALSANLVNLVDLRPARALKVYVLLSVPPAMAVGALGAPAAGLSSPAIGAAVGALLVLGPAAAAWPYDAAERGMLGDAGANAAGALAGYLAAVALPMPWLAAWAVALLALNLASERVSFSSVIEGSAALRWLDGLGRRKS